MFFLEPKAFNNNSFLFGPMPSIESKKEDDNDFEDTLDLLKTVRFDMLYSFIYSPRNGTPAAEMEDQIPKKIQNERFERLLALQNQIALEKSVDNSYCYGTYRCFRLYDRGFCHRPEIFVIGNALR